MSVVRRTGNDPEKGHYYTELYDMNENKIVTIDDDKPQNLKEIPEKIKILNARLIIYRLDDKSIRNETNIVLEKKRGKSVPKV